MFDRQACLPRQGESHPDTGRVFGLCIYTSHQSGPYPTGRTPEDPLIQDSLSSPEPGFNDEVSGAQIVFGIARRVPPPNTPKHLSNTENVSSSAKQIPHTTVESIIFHESNPLTTFSSVTSRHCPTIIQTVF